MSAPIKLPNGNLLVPLTADPNGLQALVYIDAFTGDRGGQIPMPAETGITDKWRLHRLVRASLAYNGVVQLDEKGQEIETTVPAGYVSTQVDLALLLGDARVGQAIGLLRAVLYDWLSGDLIPAPNPHQSDQP